MIGAVIFSCIGIVCLVSASLAFGSFVDIALNSAGIRAIFREKSRQATVFLSSISAIAICFCYLAITDILKDYAGYKLVLPDGSSVQSVLPDWAQCELEWMFVFWGVITVAFSQLMILWIQVKGERVPNHSPA